MRHDETDAVYFGRRAEAEAAAAAAAAHPRARDSHRELADLYRRRSDNLAGIGSLAAA